MDLIKCPCCCSKQFQDKSKLIDHLLSTNSNVVCPICKKENLQNINELISHLIADCIEPQDVPNQMSQAEIPSLIDQEYIPNQSYCTRNEYLSSNTNSIHCKKNSPQRLLNQNKAMHEKSNNTSYGSCAFVESNDRNNLDTAGNVLDTFATRSETILDTTGNHIRSMMTDTSEKHTPLVDDTASGAIKCVEPFCSVVDTNDVTACCLNNLNRVSNTNIVNPTNNIHNNLHRNKKSNLNQFGRKTTCKEENKLFLDTKTESDSSGQHCQMIKNPIKTNFNKLNSTSQEVNQNKRSLKQNRKRKSDETEKKNDNRSVRNDNIYFKNYNTSVRNADTSASRTANTNVRNDNISVKNDNIYVKSDNTSVKNANTNAKYDNPNVRNDNTSIRNENAITKKDNTSVNKTDNICVRNDYTTVRSVTNNNDARPSTSSNSREPYIHKIQPEKVINKSKMTAQSDHFSVYNADDKRTNSKDSVNNIEEQNEIVVSKNHAPVMESTSSHINISVNNAATSNQHLSSNEEEINDKNVSIINDKTSPARTNLGVSTDGANSTTLNYESQIQSMESEESQFSNDVLKEDTTSSPGDVIKENETPVIASSYDATSTAIRRSVETFCSFVNTNDVKAICLNNLNRVSNTSIVNPTNNIHNNLHRNKKSNLNQFGRKTTSKEENKLFLDIKTELDSNGQHCQMIKNPIKTNFNKLNSTSQEVNQNKRSLKQNRKRKTDETEKNNDNINLVNVANTDEVSSNSSNETLDLNRPSQDFIRTKKDNLMKTLSHEDGDSIHMIDRVVISTNNILKGNSDRQEDFETTVMQSTLENDLPSNMNTTEIVTSGAERNHYLMADETNRVNNLLRNTNELNATPNYNQVSNTVNLTNPVNIAVPSTSQVHKNITLVANNHSLPSTSKNVGKYFIKTTEPNNIFEKNENFNKKDLLKIKQTLNTNERSIIKRSNSLNIKNINSELDNPSTSKKNITKSNSFSVKNNVQNEINNTEPLEKHRTYNEKQNISIERNNLSKRNNKINNTIQLEQSHSADMLNNIEECGNTPPRLVRIINNLDKFDRMLNNEHVREDSLDMYRLDEASNDIVNHNNLREEKNINHNKNAIASNHRSIASPFQCNDNSVSRTHHLSNNGNEVISTINKGNNTNAKTKESNNDVSNHKRNIKSPFQCNDNSVSRTSHLSNNGNNVISVINEANNTNVVRKESNNTNKAGLARTNHCNIAETFHIEQCNNKIISPFRNNINPIDSAPKDVPNNLNRPILSVSNNNMSDINEISQTIENSTRKSNVTLTDLANNCDRRSLCSNAENTNADNEFSRKKMSGNSDSIADISNNIANHFIRTCDGNNFSVSAIESSTAENFTEGLLGTVWKSDGNSFTVNSIKTSTFDSIENHTEQLQGTSTCKKSIIETDTSDRHLGNNDTTQWSDSKLTKENNQNVHDDKPNIATDVLTNNLSIKNVIKTSSFNELSNDLETEYSTKDLSNETSNVIDLPLDRKRVESRHGNSDTLNHPIQSSDKNLIISMNKDSQNLTESNSISSNISYFKETESCSNNFPGSSLCSNSQSSSTRFNSIDDIENDELNIRNHDNRIHNDTTIEINDDANGIHVQAHHDRDQKNNKCKEKRKPFKTINALMGNEK